MKVNMPKRIPEEELGAIVSIVAKHPEGISFKTIRTKLESELPDWTLKRRLAKLVAGGRIAAHGKTRARLYSPIAAHRRIVEAATPVPAGGMQLSAEALGIRRLLLRPESERRPVSYHTEFLEAYRPDQTAYISGELRKRLTEMGHVGQTGLPAGTYLRQLMGRLLIDLSWNSSRLEGNTYSLLETQRLLELGESAEGKAAEETQMILNHKAAIEMLAELSDDLHFDRYTVCNLHALLSENLLPNPDAGGRVRTRLVGIRGSVYEPPQVPQLIEQCFDVVLEKAEAISDPLEQALFVMVQLPYLQPFEDVNKRVSRLAANIPLVRHNLCPLSFVDVPQDEYARATLAVYELNRVEYLRDVFAFAYERSCARYSAVRQSLGAPDPFRLKYRDAMKQMVAHVVRTCLNKPDAATWIKRRARELSTEEDCARLVEVVETELIGLHEGNIARYRLRPSEYDQWRSGWR